MRGKPEKKFKLLSDREFWKLSAEEKLQYLKTAIEASPRPRRQGKPEKTEPKKRR